jgi:hypothetical protein
MAQQVQINALLDLCFLSTALPVLHQSVAGRTQTQSPPTAHAAASDPFIWDQHLIKDRYKEEVFNATAVCFKLNSD